MPLTLNSRRYFVAAFGFFIKFWVDKWAVLNVYMKPPLYGIELFEHFEEARFRFLRQFPSTWSSPPFGALGARRWLFNLPGARSACRTRVLQQHYYASTYFNTRKGTAGGSARYPAEYSVK